ncbi:MAG: hypothetical protein ACJ735_06400 [Actinomycetes bacterium]
MGLGRRLKRLDDRVLGTRPDEPYTSSHWFSTLIPAAAVFSVGLGFLVAGDRRMGWFLIAFVGVGLLFWLARDWFRR